jgi:hypothetical protein
VLDGWLGLATQATDAAAWLEASSFQAKISIKSLDLHFSFVPSGLY